MKKLLIILAVICISCKSDVELAMERGIQYFEWNILDKSIIEFNHVVHLLSENPKNLTYEQREMLSKAYHNLAITHLQLERYAFAENYALKAYEMFSSEENWETLNSIKNRN